MHSDSQIHNKLKILHFYMFKNEKYAVLNKYDKINI